MQCNAKNDGFPDFADNINGTRQSLEDDKEDQSDMSFCMSNYARETMKMMFMMRSHHMLTDVVIEVQQELFHAHKVVLSAASPYFKAMFTGGLKESEMSHIKLQGVSILVINFNANQLIESCSINFRFVQQQWVEFYISCTPVIFG